MGDFTLEDLENRIRELCKEQTNIQEEVQQKGDQIEDYTKAIRSLDAHKKLRSSLNTLNGWLRITAKPTILYVKKQLDEKLIQKYGPYETGVQVNQKIPQEKIRLDLVHNDFVKESLEENLEILLEQQTPVIAYRFNGYIIGLEKCHPNTREDKNSLIPKDKLKILIQKAQQKINDKIKYAEQTINSVKNISELKKTYEVLLKRKNMLDASISHFNQTLKFNRQGEVVIRSSIQDLNNESYKGHFACYGYEPIVQYNEKNRCGVIFSTSKQKPLKLFSCILPFDTSLFEIAGVPFQNQYLSMISKHPILRGKDSIDSIFSKVRDGVTILPNPDQTSDEVFTQDSGGELKIRGLIMPRHWGQEYLATLATGPIVEGELFTTGFQYRAFPIDHLVVAEANLEATATYVFNKIEFDRLRRLSRSEIMQQEPNGYVGRIIHVSNRGEWKVRLHEILVRETQDNRFFQLK